MDALNKTPKPVRSTTGTETHLTEEDSASLSQTTNLHSIDMFTPKKRLMDRIPNLHPNLSEGEIEDDDNDHRPTINKNPKQAFTFEGSFSAGRPTASKHPPPANKKARSQLKKLHQLGYSSFEETGIRYWEPTLPGEDWCTHNARRQTECEAMSKWIKKMTARAEAREAANSQSVANSQPLSQSGTNLQPTVVLPSITSTAAPTPLAAPSGKRPASPTSADNKTKHHKTASQVEHLKQDLEHERKMRKQLSNQVGELLKQITTLTQKVTALTEELKQERSKKPSPQNSQAEPSSQEDTIKRIVESIIGPTLKSLTVPTTKPKPKERAEQANKKPQPPPTASTSSAPGPSYSQVARTKPSNPVISLPESSPAVATPEGTSGTQEPELELPPTQGATNNSSEDTAAFSLTRAEKRRRARQAAKERKAKDKTENATEEAKRKTEQAERSKKKAEKRKRLPTSIKHNPATLLLLPDSVTPNVLQKLQNMPEANPRQLGIKRHVAFPSGALLVTCGSATQAEQLRGITTKAGIHEKVRRTKAPEFRVHSVPSETTPAQLKADIQQRLGEIEAEVALFPYQDPRFQGQCFAVVKTTIEDLKKVAKIRSLRVGWTQCRVDTRIHVSRCSKCGLLGHSTQKCTQMEEEVIPPEQQHQAEGDSCRDCQYHNKQLDEAKRTTGVRGNRRPSNHKTGSNNCPTLLSLKKKALPLRPSHPETGTTAQG